MSLTKLYYYDTGTSTWTVEANWFKVSIADNLLSRNRILTLLLANPVNVQDDKYLPFTKIKLIDGTTSKITFLGRVTSSEPMYDQQYGQVLKLYIADYGHLLYLRKMQTNYSAYYQKRSQLINLFLNDYDVAGDLWRNIEESGSDDYISRDYSTYGKSVIEIIEELAKEDPWTNEIFDAEWRYISPSYNDNTGTYYTSVQKTGTTDIDRTVLIKYGGFSGINVGDTVHITGGTGVITSVYTVIKIDSPAYDYIWLDRPFTVLTTNIYNISICVVNTSGLGTYHNFLSGSSQYYYLGQPNPFLGFTVDTAGGGGSYGTLTYQYWNGSIWTTLPLTTTYDFSDDGSAQWTPPVDWTKVAFSGTFPHTATPPDTTSRYWIRISAASVSYTVKINSITCIRGFGYDYYVDDGTIALPVPAFNYFRRGSKNSGITAQLGATETTTIKPMFADYSFSSQSNELVTRVTCIGTANDGTKISYTASNPTAESTYTIISDKIEYVYGSDMTPATLNIYVKNRANALLNSTKDVAFRGEFSIPKYPNNNGTLVRIGELIHIICELQSIDDYYLILSVNYEEPSGISRIEIVDRSYGRSISPLHMDSIIQGLRAGQDAYISSSKIGDLMVDDAQIGTCSISKLTAGELKVQGLITTGGLVTGSNNAARIEITQESIAGYDASSSRHFYLSATDGYPQVAGSGGLNITEGSIVFSDTSGPKVTVGLDSTYFPHFEIGTIDKSVFVDISSGQEFRIINAINSEVSFYSGQVYLWNENRITNMLDPVDSQDAATKSYVDAHGGGGTIDLQNISSDILPHSGNLYVLGNETYPWDSAASQKYVIAAGGEGIVGQESVILTSTKGVVKAVASSGYGVTIAAGGFSTAPTTNNLRLQAVSGDIYLDASNNIDIHPISGYIYIYNGKLTTNLDTYGYNLNTLSGMTISAGSVGTLSTGKDLRLEAVTDIYLSPGVSPVGYTKIYHGQFTSNVDGNDQQIIDNVIHTVANSSEKWALIATVGKVVYQADERSLYVCTSA